MQKNPICSSHSIIILPGKKDLYIALADRWVPELMDLEHEVYEEIFACTFSGKPVRPEIIEKMKHAGDDKTRNTSIADYVWLPFVFDGDIPTLPWRDSWALDEFE